MARIRSIKPDAFQSDTLSVCSVLARWTFAGLWTYCDDHGRGRYDVRLIKAALFPLDDRTTLQNVADALQELAKADDAICVYEVAGRRLMHIPKWSEHQKVSHPTPSKLPACPRHDPEGSGATLENSGEIPEGFVRAPEPFAPEQGTGNREQGNDRARPRTTNDPMFDAFWVAYPKSRGKPAAIKAWKAAKKRGEDPARLVALASDYAKRCVNADPKFIPYPQKWLNDERYNDEPDADVLPLDRTARSIALNIPEAWA